MFSNNMVNIHQDYGAVVCSSLPEHTQLNRQYISRILFSATPPSTFFVFTSEWQEHIQTWHISVALIHNFYTARLGQAVITSSPFKI